LAESSFVPPDSALERRVSGRRHLLRIARYAWAAPCTAAGLVPASLMLLMGGTASIQSGVIEVAASRSERKTHFRFGAMTLGHVILGRSRQVLADLRSHELEHVKQYERWGLIFFLAYPASSLYQLLRGRHPYWFNHFEVQSRERCAQVEAHD
jgi:hypothetical protein